MGSRLNPGIYDITSLYDQHVDDPPDAEAEPLVPAKSGTFDLSLNSQPSMIAQSTRKLYGSTAVLGAAISMSQH